MPNIPDTVPTRHRRHRPEQQRAARRRPRRQRRHRPTQHPATPLRPRGGGGAQAPARSRRHRHPAERRGAGAELAARASRNSASRTPAPAKSMSPRSTGTTYARLCETVACGRLDALAPCARWTGDGVAGLPDPGGRGCRQRLGAAPRDAAAGRTWSRMRRAPERNWTEREHQAATARVARGLGLGTLAAGSAPPPSESSSSRRRKNQTSQTTNSPTSRTRKPTMKIQPSVLIPPLGWRKVPSTAIVPLAARRGRSGLRRLGRQPVVPVFFFVAGGFVTRGSGTKVTVYIKPRRAVEAAVGGRLAAGGLRGLLLDVVAVCGVAR